MQAPTGLPKNSSPKDKIESANAVLEGKPEKNTVGHADAAAYPAI
jgi:hypothetical protein